MSTLKVVPTRTGRIAMAAIAAITALLLAACGQDTDTEATPSSNPVSVDASTSVTPTKPSPTPTVIKPPAMPEGTDLWEEWADGPIDPSKIFVEGINVDSALMAPKPEVAGRFDAVALFGVGDNPRCVVGLSDKGGVGSTFGIYVNPRDGGAFEAYEEGVDVEQANKFLGIIRPHCA